MLAISKNEYNGYLLYGKRLKREICFRRNEILFYAEIQRKFTYLTSEASSIIEFELIFGIIKDFIESKKFTLKTLCIQHVTLFNIFSLSETYPEFLKGSKALEIKEN